MTQPHTSNGQQGYPLDKDTLIHSLQTELGNAAVDKALLNAIITDLRAENDRLKTELGAHTATAE